MSPSPVVLAAEAARRVLRATKEFERQGPEHPDRANTQTLAPIWQLVKPTAVDGDHWTGKLMLPDATIGTLVESGDVDIYSVAGALGLGEIATARLAGINPANGNTAWITGEAAGECCPGFLGDDGHGCCDILGAPDDCCGCDCGGGGGGESVCFGYCDKLNHAPMYVKYTYPTSATGAIAIARANPWLCEIPCSTPGVQGQLDPGDLATWSAVAGMGGLSRACSPAECVGTGTGSGTILPTGGGGPKPFPKPSPCSSSEFGHFLADGTWVPPCETGGGPLPKIPTGGFLGDEFLGGEALGGGGQFANPLPVGTTGQVLAFSGTGILTATTLPSTLPTVAPAAISGTVNDYAPGAASVLFLTTTLGADRTVTGLSMSQIDGQRLVILNDNSIGNLLLPLDDTGSAAANRFDNGPSIGTVTIAAGTQRELVYRGGAVNRWRFI